MWKDTGKSSLYGNQATGQKTEEAGIDSREKQEIYVFSKVSRVSADFPFGDFRELFPLR